MISDFRWRFSVPITGTVVPFKNDDHNLCYFAATWQGLDGVLLALSRVQMETLRKYLGAAAFLDVNDPKRLALYALSGFQTWNEVFGRAPQNETQLSKMLSNADGKSSNWNDHVVNAIRYAQELGWLNAENPLTMTIKGQAALGVMVAPAEFLIQSNLEPWRTPDALPSLIKLAEALTHLGGKARCKTIQDCLTKMDNGITARHPGSILADARKNGHGPYIRKWFTRSRGVIELNKTERTDTVSCMRAAGRAVSRQG